MHRTTPVHWKGSSTLSLWSVGSPQSDLTLSEPGERRCTLITAIIIDPTDHALKPIKSEPDFSKEDYIDRYLSVGRPQMPMLGLRLADASEIYVDAANINLATHWLCHLESPTPLPGRSLFFPSPRRLMLGSRTHLQGRDLEDQLLAELTFVDRFEAFEGMAAFIPTAAEAARVRAA